MPWPGMFSRSRANGSHNAYGLDVVTVRYRWHPLFGQTLRVCRRMKDHRGEHIFVELSDGTMCSLPSWMFSSDCTIRCSLGAPLIAVEALCELRDLLSSLHPTNGCGKASLKPFKEEVSEATKSDRKSTTEPATSNQPGSGSPRRQASRIDACSRGTSDRRIQGKPSPSKTRRRK